MNSAQQIKHHPAVSDDILLDTGARDPVFQEIYPRLPGFKLGVTHSWTRGQPFDYYRRMREEAPVMWSQIKKPSSGFWSVVRYEDVKHVELNPQIFSSQRGSMNKPELVGHQFGDGPGTKCATANDTSQMGQDGFDSIEHFGRATGEKGQLAVACPIDCAGNRAIDDAGRRFCRPRK